MFQTLLDTLFQLGQPGEAQIDCPMPDFARIVGEVPDELRQLENYRTALSAKISEADKPDLRELGLEEIVRRCFWWQLREVMGLQDVYAVGIAEGWKVWTRDKDDCDCPACKLRRAGIEFRVIEVGRPDSNN